MSLVLLLLGCGATAVQTARTIGKGKLQLAVEPTLAQPYTPDRTGQLALNLAGRYGVSERVDLGARIGGNLYEVTATFALSDPAARQITTALAPTATLAPWRIDDDSLVYADVKLPLLIGFPLGKDDEIVLGPRVRNLAGWGAAGQFDLLFGGVSVGYVWAISHNFRILPELGVEYRALALGSFGGIEVDAPLTGTFAVGILVGGR